MSRESLRTPPDDIEQFSTFISIELLSNGYEPGAPTQAWMDQDAVEDERCAVCGSRKRFFPFVRRWPRDRSGYRAFSVCVACNTAHEF